MLLDEEEYARWRRQAAHTLESVGRDCAGGDFAWACFKAEQAAQFAVKGLLRALGNTAFGHSLTRLLERLRQIGVPVPGDVEQAGRDLEREYIPTRYGDVYPSGSPFEYYDAARAAVAIENARRVIEHTDQEHLHARGSSTAP